MSLEIKIKQGVELVSPATEEFGGQPHDIFLVKLTPISCNQWHSEIIFMTFTKAIFIGN